MSAVRTGADSKKKGVMFVAMMALLNRLKNPQPHFQEGRRTVWVGRPAKGTGAPCGAPHGPPKRAMRAASSWDEKSRYLFMVRLLHLLSGLPNPCAIVSALPLYAIRAICRKKDGSSQKSTRQNHSGCANDGPPRLMTLVGPQGALRAAWLSSGWPKSGIGARRSLRVRARRLMACSSATAARR